MYAIRDKVSLEYYVKHKLDSGLIWSTEKKDAYTFPTISDCMRYIKLTMAGVKNIEVIRIEKKDPITAYERAMRGI
jgi:hypothetical protein